MSAELPCTSCKGYGERNYGGTPYGMEECLRCDGTGREPQPPITPMPDGSGEMTPERWEEMGRTPMSRRSDPPITPIPSSPK